MAAPILLARNKQTEIALLPALANRHGLLEAMAKSAARTVGSQLGWEIIRGVLGSILGKRR